MMIFIILKTYFIFSASKCLSEEDEWSSSINESSNDALFEVTGYPLTGDIPLLNRKIFRGTRVDVTEHPYVVSVRRNTGHYLTGTLITKNLVLTVAHSVVDVPIQELRVVVGENYSDRGTSLLTVLVIVIHEDFDPYTLIGDISMLRIYEDVVFRSSVKSISLVMPQLSLSGCTAFVTGWGRCDFTGKEFCLPRTSKYFPNEIIDPMLRSVSVTITSPNYYCGGYRQHETNIGKGMLCVGPAREENAAFPCLAVPGAPLVTKAKLAGILSWGFGCGYLHDLPLVYTNIQHYTNWIARNVVIFRKISKDDLTPLFVATKSYIVIDWLSRIRISKPIKHGHENDFKKLQLLTFDQDLAKLQGTAYDIRDFMYDKEFKSTKLLLYEALKISFLDKEKTTKMINQNKTNIILTNEIRPFFSNMTLLDISRTHEDYNNSDEDQSF